MVKVYCANCGRFSWEIDMVPGYQKVRCPQCKKKTTIEVYRYYDELKIRTY